MHPIIKNYKAGSFLFHENDRSRELYLIRSGRVKVFRTASGRKEELATLGKGAVVGEMALIDGKPRSASAKAVQDCSVALINADTLQKKIKGVPIWFMTIIRIISHKIRSANKRIENMQAGRHGISIILTLQYLFARAGGEGAKLETAQLKKQLVQLLSVGRSSIEETLDFLEKNRLILLEDEYVKCPNIADLYDYADFLRGHSRKSFGKMKSVSKPVKKILLALSQMLLSGNETKTEEIPVPLTDFANIVKEAANENYLDSIIDSLDEMGVAKLKKSVAENDESSSPGSSVLFINPVQLGRCAIYNKFADMVPGT